MIIWINGAYAVGKTTIAAELAKLLPGAILYDPEPLGYYIRDMVRPVEKTQDYQELAIFTPVVLEIARHLCQQYGRTIILPLGVCDPARFAAIRDGFETCDQVKHFCLTASRTTINRRLLYRGDGQQAQRWIRERLDDYLDAQGGPEFERHIMTDNITALEVARKIKEDIEEGQ